MVEAGDIVCFKNIVFEGKNLDHSFNKSRPCVCLGRLNESLYFMPLSNISTAKRYTGYYFYPNTENNLKKPSHLCIKNVFPKRDCWYTVTGRLTDDELNQAFMNIKRYHKKINEEQSKLLMILANNYFDSQKKYVDKDKIRKNKEKK